MLATLKLLLPALLPSWRFFDSVGPSPRVEFALPSQDWREFRPRPARLPWGRLVARLFWNPDGNEALFLTSCAERLLERPTAQAIAEIFARLPDSAELRFRIAVVTREGREIAYVSPTRSGA